MPEKRDKNDRAPAEAEARIRERGDAEEAMSTVVLKDKDGNVVHAGRNTKRRKAEDKFDGGDTEAAALGKQLRERVAEEDEGDETEVLGIATGELYDGPPLPPRQP
jgi:hypothetical protein